MARTFQLTPASIDALRSGLLKDPQTPGLAVEVLPSGKKRWRYRRKVIGRQTIVVICGGLFPSTSIADAREWATPFNEQIETGIDPREVRRAQLAHNTMTVAKAHGLYMAAVRDGRGSRSKRLNKPRTINDKLEIFTRDISPKLGSRIIYDVTEADLIKLVEAKGSRTA